jgi:hypothetical protein
MYSDVCFSYGNRQEYNIVRQVITQQDDGPLLNFHVFGLQQTLVQDVNQHVHRAQTIAANLLLVQQLNQPTITKFSKTFLFPHDFILFHSNIHPENVFISKSLEPIWGVYSGARSILRFSVWLMLTSSEFISGLEDTYFICSLKMF